MSLTLSIREAFKQRARYTFHSQMIGGLAPITTNKLVRNNPVSSKLLLVFTIRTSHSYSSCFEVQEEV